MARSRRFAAKVMQWAVVLFVVNAVWVLVFRPNSIELIVIAALIALLPVLLLRVPYIDATVKEFGKRRPIAAGAVAALLLVIGGLTLADLLLPREIFWPVLVAFAFWAAWWVLSFVRRAEHRAIAAVPRSITYPASTPDQFPLLDLNALQRYTLQLEDLGLRSEMEFSVEGHGGSVKISNFCRLFILPGKSTYGVVFQMFPNGNALPMTCSIFTFFTDDWSVAVGDGQPRRGGVFIRIQREVASACHGKEPVDILQKHDEWRDRMVRELGILPLPAEIETYRTFQQHRAQQKYDSIRSGPFFPKLLRYYRMKIAPPSALEFLGDWPKEAARRSRSE